MKTKNLLAFVSCLVMSLGIISILQIQSALALTDICTWEGDSGNNMNTASNWSCSLDGPTVPENGDSLIFPEVGAGMSQVPNNDISGLSVTSITFNSSTSTYTVGGSNSITVTSAITNSSLVAQTITAPITLGSGNVTITNDPAASLVLAGVIDGVGPLTKAGVGPVTLGEANTYTGATVVNAGILSVRDVSSLGTAAGGTTVNDGATLEFYVTGDSLDIAEPLTLNGAGVTSRRALEINRASGDPSELTLSGNITLGTGGAGIVEVGSDRLATFSGQLSGGGGLAYIDISNDGSGELRLSNATNTYTGTTQLDGIATIDSDQSSSAVTVTSTGILLGTGTVGAITMQSGGVIAPGHSPGCLNSGAVTFVSGSTLEIEIAGTTACTEYDQLTVTGAVDLGGATLDTSFYNTFVPSAGNSFTIISNDGADAVTGTFNGLDEGDTFEVDGVTFSISYVGGDGNDVVITVESVADDAGSDSESTPKAPNTGYRLLTSNPLLTLATTTALAGSITAIARRIKEQKI